MSSKSIHRPRRQHCVPSLIPFPNINANRLLPCTNTHNHVQLRKLIAQSQILPIPTTLSHSVAHNTKQSYLTGRDKLQGPKGSLQILCVALQVEESTGDRGLQLGGVLPRRRVDGNLVDSSHDCRRRRRRSDGEGVNWEGGWAAASSLSRTDGFLRCRSFSPTGQIARVVALRVGSEVRRLA